MSISYRLYHGEDDLPCIMDLVHTELSEPYIIYTFRYFLHSWPQLCFLAEAPDASSPIGAIVCRIETERHAGRGYIAMLSVQPAYRHRGIARSLVKMVVDAMRDNGAHEVVLETEFDNVAALSLYASLGFIREKRLYKFYMNRKDAFRLVLELRSEPTGVFPLDSRHARNSHTIS